MGKEPPGPPHPALDFVKDQEGAGLIAELAQRFHIRVRHDVDAPLALHRLDKDRSGLVRHRGFGRLHVAPWHLMETGQQRAKALDHLFARGGGDGGGGAAMERAGKGDDLDPVGLTLLVPVLAHHLDGELCRLGPGVGEEDRIGKGGLDQHIRQSLLLRNFVEVRDMPELLRLLRQRIQHHRVGMAEGRDRDPGAKVEKTATVLFDQPGAFSFDEMQRGTGIGRQNGRDHRVILWLGSPEEA